MKTLWELMSWVADKEKFKTLEDYCHFTEEYLTFATQENLSRIMPALNDENYVFFQYQRDGEYNITRPINKDLWLSVDQYREISKHIADILLNAKSNNNDNIKNAVNKWLYTTQQAIGCTLDALPSSKTNSSRKLNGMYFETFILLILKAIGLNAFSKTLKVPIPGSDVFMTFQTDVILENNEKMYAFGSIKTSSKDRLDKIFLDKFMYEKLTHKEIPEFALFLHDVQRSGKEPNFKVTRTLKKGHFKAYTLALNELDGVYYCDCYSITQGDKELSKVIRPLSEFLFNDIWVLQPSNERQIS